MTHYKQLYQHLQFQLPEMGDIKLDPFPPQTAVEEKKWSRDADIDRIFIHSPHTFKNYCSGYSSQFQQCCAKENLYPFMLAVGPSKVCIVCRDCLMTCEWTKNKSGQAYEGGDDLLTLQKWQRIKLSEVPTAICVGKHSIYLGLQSGKIVQYVFKTKSWQGSNQQLQFPIMQISLVKQQQGRQSSLIVLDSAGNILFLTFSHKTFLDKIIKTLSSTEWISFMFRNKKRQKIKRMFKNLISNKEKPKDKEHQTQTSSGETLELPAPYTYNKFDLKTVNQDILLAVFRKNCLELLVLDQKYKMKSNITMEVGKEGDMLPVWIELGEGGFQNANARHQVLVVGLGLTMQFYRIIQTQDGYEVVKVSEVTTAQPLIYGKFLSNNLLLVGDSQKAYLTSVGDRPQPLVSVGTHTFSYVDFFIDQEGLQADKQLILGNLLGLLPETTNGDRSFLILEGKRLVIGSVMSWQSILLNLILQSQWEKALGCFQDIYSGRLKLCCRVNENLSDRNKQMRRVCQPIVRGYLDQSLSTIRQKNFGEGQLGCCINNFIYFLLKCDYSQLLFSQAENVLTEAGYDSLFISQLSGYVEQSNGYNLRLPFISEKYLNLLISKYREQHRQYVLERLFMQFDLTQMERLLLLGICLNQELYRSLIAICCQQKDYITPIVKLCGIGLNIPSKLPRIAEIIYWYLHECLCGHMTDYGNESDYINMLAILINFIFIPSSLEMLLAANHVYLMQIIYQFFDPKIMRFILQNQSMFFMRKDKVDEPLFEQNCLSEFKLYQKMLAVLVAAIDKNQESVKKDYEHQLHRLLITLMLRNHFPFLAHFKITIVRYFINHPLLFVGEEELNEEKEVEVNGQLMRLLDSLVRSLSDKCLSLREKAQDQSAVARLQEMLKQQKQKEFNNILQLIMLSPFSQQLAETKCYIYHELGNYETVLEIYLRMLNKKVRMKVFLYLQNNLNEFSQLTQQFLKYMISLLGIDQDKTVQLLWNLKDNWVDPQEVIDKLVDYPSIQLGYIERCMKSGGDRSKKLLLRHLQIVLRQHGDQIQHFIQKIQYPLEQAFRMCEERNNRMGKACILIKSGRNMEGVMIISEIFLQSVKEYLPTLKKSGIAEEERRTRILSQLRTVLSTCHKEWMIDNERGEDIWEKNTEIIFKKLAVNNVDTPHVPEVIRTFLNEIITEILSAMLEQVSTDFFLNRFVKTFGSLPQRIFMQAYKYIYNRLQFTFTLQKLNKDLLQIGQVQLWHNIMQTIYRAHICELNCHACTHLLTSNEKMITFSCQHVMHEQCYYEKDIKKTKNQLCPLCFNPLESYIVCGEQKPLRYRLQVDQKSLLQAKISKMGYYDRTTQIAAMQQWQKFQEWVDL